MDTVVITKTIQIIHKFILSKNCAVVRNSISELQGCILEFQCKCTHIILMQVKITFHWCGEGLFIDDSSWYNEVPFFCHLKNGAICQIMQNIWNFH